MRFAEAANKLGGIFTIAMTPFRDDGSLDVNGIEELVRYQVRTGIDGLLIGGTYGEFPSMTVRERELLLETVLAAAGALPVLACSAHSDPRQAIKLTEHAMGAGAFAAMLMPPFVSEVRESDVIDYFQTVYEATGAPLVIYNTPGSGFALAPSTLARLAEIPGVIGVKQGVTAAGWLDETQVLIGDRLRVLCASDLILPAGLALGMDGGSCTNASFMPELFVDMFRAARSNDWARALELHRSWAPFRTLIRKFGQPQTTKAAMQTLGLPAGPVRPPLHPLDAKQLAEVRQVLLSIGLVPVETQR